MVAGRGEILIVGAGPTGLAAALFLSHRGIVPRIVEQSTDPSRHSKALGVNPRTLQLLAGTGVDERLIAQGRRATGMNLWRGGRRLARIDLASVGGPYPFMLVHSQARSEQALAEALEECGVAVERGVRLADLDNGAERAVVRLDGAAEEETSFVTVLGADGAHSAVRHAAGIEFPGFRYPETWRLCDVELETDRDPDDGHIFLLDDGVLFLLRIEGNLWRIISSVAAPLERLPAGTRAAAVQWDSDFTISQRVAAPLQAGRCWLAGDAAHVHSPLGARGMNLGIEDAYVFATLAADGGLTRYEAVRRPAVEGVVRRIATLMRMPRTATWQGRLLRRLPWLVPPLTALFGRRVVAPWALGLDHDVEL